MSASPWRHGSAPAPAALSPDHATAQLDTPRQFMAEAAQRVRQRADDDDETQRTAKSRKVGSGVSRAAGAVLSTCLTAAIFTGAVGYTAYSMWRHGGSTSSPGRHAIREIEHEEERPPPYEVAAEALFPSKPRDSRNRLKRPRRTNRSSFIAQNAPSQPEINFAPVLAANTYKPPANEPAEDDDDAFSSLNARIQHLILSGQAALSAQPTLEDGDDNANHPPPWRQHSELSPASFGPMR